MMSSLYNNLLTEVNEGHECVMVTYLEFHSGRNGAIIDKILLAREELDKKSFPLAAEVYEHICISLETGKPQMIELSGGKAVLVETFKPKPRLIVFGGGHVAKPVAELASRVGFSTVIIDDRPVFANKERFPEADRVICEDFEKSFDLIDLRESDFVVVITRGHRYDGVVLRRVLKYNLSYMGMIGSRRRVAAMMEELLNEGFTKEKLDSVNSPIGLDIGAVTPDEIAISIIAQLINYKNKGVQNKYGKDYVFPEFDGSVAGKISEESTVPKALITILSSKGSVPRKAGAKMIAYLDGRTIGSIGGGCSEARVISRARDLMHDIGFIIEHVDMTGEVAESEGMVCGGVMEVLVEVMESSLYRGGCKHE